MTATAHALVSGAIASATPVPGISYLLSFVSHFVMDAVPHWDFGIGWRSRPKLHTGLIAIADTILGFSLAYFMFSGKTEPHVLLFSMICGNIPDWLETPYYIFFAKHNKEKPSHDASSWEKLSYRVYKTINIFHAKAQFPFGVYTQVATVMFFLLLLR